MHFVLVENFLSEMNFVLVEHFFNQKELLLSRFWAFHSVKLIVEGI